MFSLSPPVCALSLMPAHVWDHICHSMIMGIRRWPVGDGPLFPWGGSWEWNSDYQAWWQVPLAAVKHSQAFKTAHRLSPSIIILRISHAVLGQAFLPLFLLRSFEWRGHHTSFLVLTLDDCSSAAHIVITGETNVAVLTHPHWLLHEQGLPLLLLASSLFPSWGELPSCSVAWPGVAVLSPVRSRPTLLIRVPCESCLSLGFIVEWLWMMVTLVASQEILAK